MKNLKLWAVIIAALVIGLICHLAFGWSMWAVGLAVIFVWLAEKYSRILYVPAVVIIGLAFFNSTLPLTSSKGTWGVLKLDLSGSRAIDSVQVKADLILEVEKNRQKEALLGQYKKLLTEGKVQQARALMDSIDNLFYPKKEVVAVPTVPTNPPVVEDPPVEEPLVSQVRDSVFTKGIYTINVKGETPFNIVVVPSRGGCARYSLKSPSWNYTILIPGRQPIQASPAATLPYVDRPVFKLASQSGDIITLTVA